MAHTPFPPTRTAALERLAGFLPHAGRDYAARRNYDLGAGAHTGVSCLSPYIRHRIITEEEVLRATLGRFSQSSAQKFIQEVFWRTYWKGWLELRPAVWDQYQSGLRRALDDVQTQSGLRSEWEAACRGETSIDAFDHWARELAETGYLHNHARMWFASIWIFTLRLPWELGADFFLRHLLDGDPASNTLGWRWVGGIQTRGKTYLARPDNIARYTEGRFHPEGLAKSAVPLDTPEPPARRVLPEAAAPREGLRTGVILHAEDLSPGFVGLEGRPVAVLRAEDGASPLQLASHVPEFLDASIEDCCARHGIAPDLTTSDPLEVAAWAAELGLEQIVTAYAPVGATATALGRLALERVPLIQVRRSYDSAAWPHATHGFFRFKERIPDLIGDLGLARAA